jgi:hypothetical protein
VKEVSLGGSLRPRLESWLTNGVHERQVPNKDMGKDHKEGRDQAMGKAIFESRHTFLQSLMSGVAETNHAGSKELMYPPHTEQIVLVDKPPKKYAPSPGNQ